MTVVQKEPYYTDLEAWQSYCKSPAKTAFDPTIYNALRVAVPALYEDLANIARQNGTLIGDMPYDTEGFTETRVPIVRAGEAISKAASAKDVNTKRHYMETAKAWLLTPHPLQGDQTRIEIKNLLDTVCVYLENPSENLPGVLSKLKGGN